MELVTKKGSQWFTSAMNNSRVIRLHQPDIFSAFRFVESQFRAGFLARQLCHIHHHQPESRKARTQPTSLLVRRRTGNFTFVEAA
jgi:hypothetical protein